MVLLNGPGGIGTTRARRRGLEPVACSTTTAARGRAGEKMAIFIRESLVADASAITDEVIDGRYRDSLDPGQAGPASCAGSGRTAPRTIWRMDLTRDPRPPRPSDRWSSGGHSDKVNRFQRRPHAGAHTMPDCSAYLAAGVGHWVQWETLDLFNRLALDFPQGRRVSARMFVRSTWYAAIETALRRLAPIRRRRHRPPRP